MVEVRALRALVLGFSGASLETTAFVRLVVFVPRLLRTDSASLDTIVLLAVAVLVLGGLVEQVQGGLGAGEVAERGGAAGVEGRGGPEGLLGRGTMSECLVDVEGVGEVEHRLEAHQAVVVDVALVHGGVPLVRTEVTVGVEVALVLLGIRTGLGGQLEPLDRLSHEPVELRGPDPPGDGGDLRVDPSDGLTGEGGAGVDGGLGDHPGLPRRHPSGVDLRPQAGQAVAQLEGVADELLRRDRRDAEDAAELGDAELRHQRTALTGDGFLVLAAGSGERGGVVDRLRRVEVGPPGGEVELAGGFGVLAGT